MCGGGERARAFVVGICAIRGIEVLDEAFGSADIVEKSGLRCFFELLLCDFSATFFFVCIPLSLLAFTALLVELVLMLFVCFLGSVVVILDLADGGVCALLLVVESLPVRFQGVDVLVGTLPRGFDLIELFLIVFVLLRKCSGLSAVEGLLQLDVLGLLCVDALLELIEPPELLSLSV